MSPWKKHFEKAMQPISIHDRLNHIMEILTQLIDIPIAGPEERLELYRNIKAVIHTHLDAVAQGKGCEEYKND